MRGFATSLRLILHRERDLGSMSVIHLMKQGQLQAALPQNKYFNQSCTGLMEARAITGTVLYGGEGHQFKS